MPDNKMEIKIQVNNKKANKALKDTENAVKGVEKQSKKGAKQLGRMRIATAGLRRSMGALRNNLLLVTFAFGGIATAVGKSIKLFGEQELAEKKLSSALGRTSQSLLDQASALQSVTTFGDENIIQAQALIAAFTDDEEAIKRATVATLDLASAKGMDLFAAADLVAKTLGSTTNAMSRYGIEVTGAVGSTERLDTLTKNIAKTFGGQAAAEAETMRGALQQASNAAGDASEKFGRLLQPSIIASAKLFKGAAEAVGTYFDSLKTLNTLEIESTEDLGRLTDEYRTQQKELDRMTDRRDRFLESFSEEKLLKLGDDLKEPILLQMLGSKEDIEEAQKRLDLLAENIQRILFPGIGEMQKEFSSYQEALMNVIGLDSMLKTTTEERLDVEKTDLELYRERREAFGDLQKVKEKDIKIEDAIKIAEAERAANQKKATKAIFDSAVEQGRAYNVVGEAALIAAQDVVMAKVQEAVANYIADSFAKAGIFGAILSAGAGGIIGSLMQGAINSISPPKLQQAATGMDEIVTQPTMILAGEAGAEQVSITPLEGPNIDGPQGTGNTFNISISGNVLTQDFVENELAESIRTAVRRGTDFGIS